MTYLENMHIDSSDDRIHRLDFKFILQPNLIFRCTNCFFLVLGTVFLGIHISTVPSPKLWNTILHDSYKPYDPTD